MSKVLRIYQTMCCSNLIVNIGDKHSEFTSLGQMQMNFVTTGLKCATTWFEQFLQAATNSHNYSPTLIVTGVFGPIGTFYPAHHNASGYNGKRGDNTSRYIGNTDGNGPKWRCAGSSCHTFQRTISIQKAGIESDIPNISIWRFRHFNPFAGTFML